MDIVDLINSLISSQDAIIRFALVVLISIYGLFALIVAIQVGNLNKVVNQAAFSSSSLGELMLNTTYRFKVE